MSFTSLLIILGPVVALCALAVVSVNLANSGFLERRKYVGWALLGFALVIFFSSVIWQARTAESSLTLSIYIIGLSFLAAMQGPLVAELLTLTFWPDRSRGLKLLRSYSAAERKIIEGDLSGSIAEYESAIAEDPDDIEARLRLAETLFESKEFQKTVDAYEAVLNRAPKLSAERHCLILTRLARIHAEEFGDVDKARELLATIIEKHPDTEYSRYAKECISGL